MWAAPKVSGPPLYHKNLNLSRGKLHKNYFKNFIWLFCTKKPPKFRGQLYCAKAIKSVLGLFIRSSDREIRLFLDNGFFNRARVYKLLKQSRHLLVAILRKFGICSLKFRNS